jgi:hypothetical protein
MGETYYTENMKVLDHDLNVVGYCTGFIPQTETSVLTILVNDRGEKRLADFFIVKVNEEHGVYVRQYQKKKNGYPTSNRTVMCLISK